jgi:hypothetical protein
MNGHIALTGEKTANRVLVGKTELKRSLRKPRRRWEGNVRIDGLDSFWLGMENNGRLF